MTTRRAALPYRARYKDAHRRDPNTESTCNARAMRECWARGPSGEGRIVANAAGGGGADDGGNPRG
jgi:hypothetical protein